MDYSRSCRISRADENAIGMSKIIIVPIPRPAALDLCDDAEKGAKRKNSVRAKEVPTNTVPRLYLSYTKSQAKLEPEPRIA
jgi:hypothetical protein